MFLSRPCFRALVFALISCLLFVSSLACLADVEPWDADAQGQFITALCRGSHGTTWIGTEDLGVWRFDPAAPKGSQYARFSSINGYEDNNAYALVCDKAGRVWAGTLNHGVAVFNGKTWRTYGPVDGPLGSRVFALAVNPVDGGVWGATEAGLFRYKNSRWTYFTRADGLPSDQANALAFAPDGTLYVGTQCDGIAVASPADNYKTWRVVSGPKLLPTTATGVGLPSALINCLLVTQSGTVYAGTTCGLAGSKDGGRTWSFVRGLDWKAKLAGLLHPVTPSPAAVSTDLLSEDYVTCLAEGADGRLFVGHRQTGLEAFAAKTGKRVQSGADGSKPDSYISSLLVSGQTAWIGQYGGGLLTPDAVPADTFAAEPALASSAPVPPFPTPAQPPTVAELNAMLTRVKSLKGELPIGGAAYLGEDWQTQGDWVGRYGSRYAVLCAAGAPLDQYVLSDPSYKVTGFCGPHHQDGDGLRSWCHWVHTNDPRVLWDPVAGYRREAEWDDHGEDYPQSYEGPDVWAEVTVPAGLHRLSLYLMNKDGREGSNRYRNYLVELKTLPPRASNGAAVDPSAMPTLASARVRNFWFGVYEQFQVRGPAVYMVKVGKNSSLNTILQTVMLDKISGPSTEWETRRSVWYGQDVYHSPAVPQLVKPSAALAAAQSLWQALDENRGQEGADDLAPLFRVSAYRAPLTNPKEWEAADTQTIAASWRWQLCLWNPADRNAFQQAMTANWQSLVAVNPKLAFGNQ